MEPVPPEVIDLAIERVLDAQEDVARAIDPPRSLPNEHDLEVADQRAEDLDELVSQDAASLTPD